MCSSGSGPVSRQTELEVCVCVCSVHSVDCIRPQKIGHMAAVWFTSGIGHHGQKKDSVNVCYVEVLELLSGKVCTCSRSLLAGEQSDA